MPLIALFLPERMICPVVLPPIVRLLNCDVWIEPAPFLKVSVPATDAAPSTSSAAVGALVLIPILLLVVSRLRRLDAKFNAVVLEPKVTAVLFASVIAVPLMVKLPPTVVSPVPVVNVVAPVWVKLPESVVASTKLIRPVPEFKTMLPVVSPPKVKVCALVVPRLPAPVRNVLLFVVPAEIEAVGVPPATFMKANRAEAVEVLPSKISSVKFVGVKAPAFLCHRPTMPVSEQLWPEIQTTPDAFGRV